MYQKYNNYDKYPEITINGFNSEAFQGYSTIASEITRAVGNRKKSVVVLDFYPGVNEKEVLDGFDLLKPVRIFSAESCTYDNETYEALIEDNLTDDRVFGVVTLKNLSDIFLKEKIESIQSEIEKIESGIVIVYGTGAGLITMGDIFIYCDLARWEIQKRYKQGIPNYKGNNGSDQFSYKYKRGFFVDWKMADRHKKRLFDKFDYLLDTNEKNCPKMISGKAFTHALKSVSHRPFRLVPYFDPGVWGGQWMKDVCGLDKDKPNYAWSFDGVPEENSLYLRFGDIRIEIPAIDLVFYQSRPLLGERVHARFGDEFPIRFDFLDTVEGGNLSLQVHPLTEYIQEKFGMHYTQDESYYILDCADKDNYVYLGLKESADKTEMISDLKKAEDGKIVFDTDKYINKIPVKKHDHILIPAGTIHCSGKNTMVLEISATPYIFTFKLWDWGRLGLDGRPRPTHIEHGEKVICYDRTTDWVYNNLVNKFEEISRTHGIYEEKTGLHEREFIETRRHTFTKPVMHNSNGSVCVFNLIEGEEAVVSSPTGEFEPFKVHYAETFIIPACIESYLISPTEKSDGQPIMTIKAYVR